MMKKGHIIEAGLVLSVPVLILCVYLNDHVMNSPFIFDDLRMIRDDASIRNLGFAGSFREAFMSRFAVAWTFARDYSASGLDVSRYHVTNIVIHIVNSLVVFLFARTVLGFPGIEVNRPVRTYAALFASLLFAIHPIQSQAVIYISQRSTLMAAGFYLLSVLLYLLAREDQIRRKKKTGRILLLFAGAAASGLLAFFSKQNSVSLPVMIVAVEFALVSTTWQQVKPKLIWAAGFILIAGAVLLVVSGAFRGSGTLSTLLNRIDYMSRETTQVDRFHYLLTQFGVIVVYMKLILFPKGFNIDWQYPFADTLFDGYTLFSLALILVVMASAFRYRKTHPLLFLAVAWFFVALSIESSIIPIRDALFEHRVYLALPGPVLAAAFYLFKLYRKQKGFTVVAAVVLVGLLSLVTLDRTADWRSEVALWEDSIRKNPSNYKALTNLGIAYAQKKDFEKAYDAFMAAIKVNPAASYAYINLGNLMKLSGDLSKAEAFYSQAVKIEPNDPEAAHNLGALYLDTGRFDMARPLLEKAVRHAIQKPIYLLSLGRLYMQMADDRRAFKSFQRLDASYPGYTPKVSIYLAMTAARIGKSRQEIVGYLHQAARQGFNDWNLIENDASLMQALGPNWSAGLKQPG